MSIRTCLLQVGTLFGVNKVLSVTSTRVIWVNKDLPVTSRHVIWGQ